MPTEQNHEFDRYVRETGESSNIDAKGPVKWDGHTHAAGLAKDIAAFANSKDGGVIVIGKEENDTNDFSLVGVSEDEAKSFDTTVVANWVNRYFSPPINLVCHSHMYDGRRFIIITVDEFADIPHLCIRSFENPDKAGKTDRFLLREGTIYVRTANAASAPIRCVEELRSLIGIATVKRGQELLAMFSSAMKGNPLLPNNSVEEQFDQELEKITIDLGEKFADELKNGAWSLRLHPITFDSQRFAADRESLEARIARNQVLLRSEFPPRRNGTHLRDWGLCNVHYEETWALSPTGLFFLARPFYENKRQFESSWRVVSGQSAEPKLQPGEWLDFKPSLLTIAEFFAFSERFIEEYGVGERFLFELKATSISGRRLVTTDTRIDRDMTPPCRASRFAFSKELSVEEFRSNWEELAAQAMKQFSDLFPDTNTSIQTMRYWVERFKHRQY